MREVPRILVVDDIEDNREILRARLERQRYEVLTAGDGEAALDMVGKELPDLVLLDVMMPKLDGIEVVRRLKGNPRLPFIPVVLLTSKSDFTDVVSGLEAGADEYLTKPIDPSALLARVKAMLRIKGLQDQVVGQAATLREQSIELMAWNNTLEARVLTQVEEIERISRLKRFLAPQVADSILASPAGEEVLKSHRGDISVLFCDLRGFTSFSETAEPEDVMSFLREYHESVGERAFHHEGTLERFTGDSVLIFFNDPIPCPDYCARAVRLSIDIRERARPVLHRWNLRGAELGIGIGISAGFATLGRVGFDKRFDYAAIGTVTNLAARLCGAAESGQILISRRVMHEINGASPSRFVADMRMKGFLKPIPVYEIL